MENVPLAVWGFLVGFVGWPGFFRLPTPIVDRLFGFRSDATKLKALATVVVIVFLLVSVLLMLSLMPMFLLVVRCVEPATLWRDMFGTTFMGSLAGFLVHGLLRKCGS